MALIDSIEKHKTKSESKCTLAIILEMLDNKDRKDLLDHIKKGTPSMALVAALRSEGYHIAEVTFNNHRNGRCKCPAIE
jgi:regulator of replication initiation timing